MSIRNHFSLLLLAVCSLLCVAASSSGETTRYDHTDGLASPIVGGGVQDRNGLLWFATWNGLDCYDGYEFHHIRIRPGDGSSISTNHIRDISLTPGGDSIICHTDGDIFAFSLADYTFRDVPEPRRERLLREAGKTWHGLTDRQDNVWTSDLTGLYKRVRPHHPASVLRGTSGEEARALLLDREGQLWVGFRNSRSVKVYGCDGNIIREFTLPSAPYSFFQHSSGDVWAGCKPGMLITGSGAALASEPVYDMAEDAQGRLWLATFGGGVRCVPDPTGASPRISESFGGRRVRRLLITPDNNIVAATNDGLLAGHIDLADWRRTRLRAIRRDGNRSTSLASNSVMTLARDSRGNIYVGTESSGVDVIPEKELFSGVPEFVHLELSGTTSIPDICNAMALSGDTLLMIVGTDRVTALNPSTGQTVGFSRAFWGDSCRFEEATPVRLPDGRWAFGSRAGVLTATPHNLYSRGYRPPLVFTTLSVGGEAPEFRLPACDTITLPASGRNITVGFAALDYADNSGILYRTRLDGSPWSTAGVSRTITLFNLAPGTHVLEAESTDRYGRWVDNARRLTVIVEPYWYETWWARAGACLLCAALVAAGLWTVLYVRRISRQRRELLEKYMAAVSAVEAPLTAKSDERPEPMAPLTPQQKPEDTQFLNRVRDYIERNLDNRDASVDDMAAAAAASRSTLNRRLRQMLGVSAAQLLIETRLTRAAQMLAAPGEPLPIADIALRCGYADQQYFQRAFRKRFGLSPADYRQQHT